MYERNGGKLIQKLIFSVYNNEYFVFWKYIVSDLMVNQLRTQFTISKCANYIGPVVLCLGSPCTRTFLIQFILQIRAKFRSLSRNSLKIFIRHFATF